MKAIVAGGAGFLGSNLCDALIKKEYQVVCIDNLITGSTDNIKHLMLNPNFRFIQDDITKPLPEGLEADEIYHLASPASPNIHSQKSYHALPFETMRVNTKGTWKLCDLAVKLNAKFLYASTSEVYGEPLEHPQKETYRGNVSSIGPRSVYDEAKRFGETITSAFARSKNLNGKIIRIFNTYGPGMALDDGRVVIEFMIAALKNKPLQIFGNGQQTRSFCYISDLIDGIIKVMSQGRVGEVYNLGNPQEFTISDLAQKVLKVTGSASQIEKNEPMPEDDPTRRCPDITKTRSEVGFNPVVGIDEGLKLLSDYLKPLV